MPRHIPEVDVDVFAMASIRPVNKSITVEEGGQDLAKLHSELEGPRRRTTNRPVIRLTLKPCTIVPPGIGPRGSFRGGLTAPRIRGTYGDELLAAMFAA